VPKSKRIAELLDEPAVKALAASATVAAGGALAAKLMHDHLDATAERTRRRYRLRTDESPRAGTTRVVDGQLDRAVRRLHQDEVHDARKALKRVRTALRLNRQLLGRKRFGELNRTFRDAGRSLSWSRDAEALVEALDELVAQSDDRLAAKRWDRFRTALLQEARPGGQAADNGRPSEAVAAGLERAREGLDTWPLPDSGGPERLAGGLKRIYRQGRRAARAARKDSTVENLHELRKRSKDLWYSAQLLHCSSPKRAERLAKRAHRLSDLLGEDHDLALLRQRAERQPELFDPGEHELLIAQIEVRRRRLCQDSLACAKRLYRRKPGKVVRLLELAG
jgi:CHAD domain-containing protein